MTSEVFAPAKINLTLHVTGQRSDGYHLLDSLVVFADVGDLLRITPQDQMSINVSGPFASGVPTDARNLIWKAMTLANTTAQVQLEKNLPHGGGIGGGSSDAAAVLRYFGVSEGAGTLGADVPVCLTPVAQRMRRIGDLLSRVDDLPVLHAVMVNPGVHMATPDVFKALTHKENPPMPKALPRFAEGVDAIDWLATQRNDLQAAAVALAPEIAQVLEQIARRPEVRLARMSGSGSTCFGLCASQADAASAAAAITAQNPGYWVRACQLS